MPKCNCRDIHEIVNELVQAFINGRMSDVKEEILSYKKEQAIALTLLLYTELKPEERDSFKDAMLVLT